MKNNVLIVLLFSSFAAGAQTASSSATQTTKLSLENAIDISFLAGSKGTGPIVDLAFTTVNDYADGVESADQQVLIRSNKRYNVTVKSNSSTFTFAGKASPMPVMPVEKTLNMQVTMNKTGGKQAGAFTKGYGTISEKAQDLLLDCSNGSDQAFNVMYKATPGFEYPAGTYTVDVVFTATQS